MMGGKHKNMDVITIHTSPSHHWEHNHCKQNLMYGHPSRIIFKLYYYFKKQK